MHGWFVMSYRALNIALVMLLFVSGFSFAAANTKIANYASEVADSELLAEVVSQCPDSPTKVDCSSQDRNTKEWIGADGCKYECRASSPPSSTCPKSAIVVDCTNSDRAASEWTGTDGCQYKCAEIKATPTCPTKSTIMEDCNAIDSNAYGSKTWTDSQGCAHACKKTTAPATDNCKNPKVPIECFDGTGASAYLYKDANGCFQYGCKLGKCAFDAKPRIVNCAASDTSHPDSQYWWDEDGCYTVCAGSELAKWIFTPIGTLCLDKPELSFTGYFPNSAYYSEFYNRDSPIHKAVVVQRIERKCSDNSFVKQYELWLKSGNENGKMQTYCNYACRNKYQEQCILDGTFDTYVDEWCLDANGNKIVPLTSGGLSSEIYGSKPAAASTGSKSMPVPTAVSSSDASAAEVAPASAPYTLALYKGWNMVSLPVNSKLSMEKVAAACGAQKHAWKYGPGGYMKETTLVPGTGYWIKASVGCALEVPGGQFTGPLAGLSAGWNLVGATWDGMNIREYAGTCSITSGPWHYSPSNSADSPYTQSSTLSQGKAYWIKVASACALDGDAMPPSPPN